MTAARRTLLAAAMLGVLALSAAPAGAAGLDPQEDSSLSPLLAELSKPSVQSRPEATQAAILGVPVSGPGSLLRAGGRVVVNVRFDYGAIASRDNLHAAGAQVITASRRDQSATLAVPPADLKEIAALPTVAAVTPERAPMTYAVDCEGGSVVSEGLQQLEVEHARTAFGARGKGITVGVLSDSFDTATEAVGGGPIATHAEEDVLTADLPGPQGSCSGQQEAVDVLQDEPDEGTDEGRGMAQIVHDLAPHASLAFATAFASEESFAHNIEQLAKPRASGGAGAQVIVDDVGWFREPFFQDGPVAVAVNKVTNVGVTYVSAAGNNNLFDSKGNEIASWEAPEFRDAGSCPAALGGGVSSCMNFKPISGTDNTFGITVEPGATLLVDLQWAEPWNGVKTDLDASLLNASGSKVLAVSEEPNIQTQTPYELIGWENPSATEAKEVQLVIDRCSGACDPAASASATPRLKFALMENGAGVSSTEYPESEGNDVVGPTIFGHAGAASAITVGAIRFNRSTVPERYSSRGPVTHYFGPVEGTKAAAELESPEQISKPDLVATDCGATTFFAHLESSRWRFCGTSAAAPHAAAVAALLKQAEPLASASEIRQTLTATATPVGSFPHDAVGDGLIDAFEALGSLPQPLEIDDPASTEVPPVPEYEPEPEPEKKSEPEPEKKSEPEPEHKTPAPGEQAPSPSAISTTPDPTPQGVAPVTAFAKHPRKLVRTPRALARVVFRFAANPANASFRCQFDGSPWRACTATVSRWFGLGQHVVRVQARAGGLLDPTPAVFRFRVARSR